MSGEVKQAQEVELLYVVAKYRFGETEGYQPTTLGYAYNPSIALADAEKLAAEHPDDLVQIEVLRRERWASRLRELGWDDPEDFPEELSEEELARGLD